MTWVPHSSASMLLLTARMRAPCRRLSLFKKKRSKVEGQSAVASDDEVEADPADSPKKHRGSRAEGRPSLDAWFEARKARWVGEPARQQVAWGAIAGGRRRHAWVNTWATQASSYMG